MPVSTITHNGQQILFVDYTHSKTKEERFQVLEEYANEARKCPDGSVLALWDVTDQFASPDFMKRVKELKKEVFDSKVVISAIIGITGVKRILFDGYNKLAGGRVRAFSTKEQALDFLASKG